MSYPWFKFYGLEYLADQKIFGLTACERSCWITLLAFASQSNGVVSFLTEEQLLLLAGVNFQNDEWDVTLGVTKRFEKLGMVKIEGEKIIVLNWSKRQETSLTNAERQAKFRDKQAKSNEKVTKPVTKVTLDKEEEEDKEEDKNILYKAQAPTKTTDELWNEMIGPLRATTAPSTLIDFENHWRAKNHGGKKERWQMEKVFDINRRMATWKRNDEKFDARNKAFSKLKDVDERPVQREARMSREDSGPVSIGAIFKKQ